MTTDTDYIKEVKQAAEIQYNMIHNACLSDTVQHDTQCLFKCAEKLSTPLITAVADACWTVVLSTYEACDTTDLELVYHMICQLAVIHMPLS